MADLKIPTFIQAPNVLPKEKKRKEDWMAEIEEIIEEGESCVTFICDKIALGRRSVEKYMREMTQEGILQKSRRVKIAGSLEWMHIIAPAPLVQKTLIDEPATRDWLVAAFFGEHKPCA